MADHEELLGREEQSAERFETMKWVEVERKVVDLLVEQVRRPIQSICTWCVRTHAREHSILSVDVKNTNTRTCF